MACLVSPFGAAGGDSKRTKLQSGELNITNTSLSSYDVTTVTEDCFMSIGIWNLINYFSGPNGSCIKIGGSKFIGVGGYQGDNGRPGGSTITYVDPAQMYRIIDVPVPTGYGYAPEEVYPGIMATFLVYKNEQISVVLSASPGLTMTVGWCTFKYE